MGIAGLRQKVDRPLPAAPKAEPHWTEYFQCDKPSQESTIDSPASPLQTSLSPSRTNSPGASDRENVKLGLAATHRGRSGSPRDRTRSTTPAASDREYVKSVSPKYRSRSNSPARSDVTLVKAGFSWDTSSPPRLQFAGDIFSNETRHLGGIATSISEPLVKTHRMPPAASLPIQVVPDKPHTLLAISNFMAKLRMFRRLSLTVDETRPEPEVSNRKSLGKKKKGSPKGSKASSPKKGSPSGSRAGSPTKTTTSRDGSPVGSRNETKKAAAPSGMTPIFSPEGSPAASPTATGSRKGTTNVKPREPARSKPSAAKRR